VKLVACPQCHAQYDVADVVDETIACPCGAKISARPPAAVDAAVKRCAACGALVADGEQVCPYCQAAVARDPAPAGPVCPECYARNPERARHCTACGVAFLPQPVRTSADPLECPVCVGVRLAARNLGGIWVDECPMCLGLWAPGEVMDRLVDRVRERRRRDGNPSAEHPRRERRAEWQAAVTYRHCPVCRGAMQRKNFGHRSGVIVDWCGSHGTWLDAHEMEDIAAYVLEGGLERQPAQDKDGSWNLPADPARAAAIVAAEQLLADERARSNARNQDRKFLTGRPFKGIGDLIAEFLK
jgi:Zn-finger nucleic acid-binding protein/ribosomal protein L40E